MPRVACVQMDVKFGDIDTNVSRVTGALHQLASDNVQIAVFPECCIAGYCIDSDEQKTLIGIQRDSAELLAIQSTVDSTGVTAIFGFSEHCNGKYYNTAALFQQNEKPQYYRKTHLPELGYDKFVAPGQELPIFETKHGRLAILICFDIRFPEPARVMALKGADAVFLPTNWPNGADVSADFIAIARAAENKIYVVTCNRVGTERGFGFIGKSKIISPMGVVLASAGNGEEIIVADLNFDESRNKRIATIPGRYETTVFESRRPELYGPILCQTEQNEGKTQ